MLYKIYKYKTASLTGEQILTHSSLTLSSVVLLPVSAMVKILEAPSTLQKEAQN